MIFLYIYLIGLALFFTLRLFNPTGTFLDVVLIFPSPLWPIAVSILIFYGILYWYERIFGWY